jgi:hypothetical protein
VDMLNMLQGGFLSLATRVYARKPVPATLSAISPQIIPDSSVRRQGRHGLAVLTTPYYCQQ